MSSPFELIRNNQKTLLPIIGIGCMVAFLVVPYTLQYLQDVTQERRRTLDEERIIGTWDEGQIDVTELRGEAQMQQMLAQFLSEMSFSLKYGNLRLEGLPPQFQNQILELRNRYTQNAMQALQAPQTAEQAFQCKLQERLGADLGIVVTDKQVNEFIDSFRVEMETNDKGESTNNAVKQFTKAEMVSLIANMGRQYPSFNDNSVFEMVRRAIVRLQVKQIVGVDTTVYAEPPLARFNSFNMLRRRAQVEVIPVKVEDFLSQVPNPTDAQLKTFFDEHKATLPNPNSAEIGLRTPPRVDLQLFSVNFDQLIDGYKPKIENKAIADYYEANKDQLYRKVKLPEIPVKETPETGKTETPKTEVEKAGDTQTPAEPKPGDEKTESAKTPEGSPAVEAPKSETPKSDAPKAETPKGETPKVESGKQSSLTRDGLIPVAFQEDAAKTQAESKADAAKSEPAKSDAAKSVDAKTQAETQPAAEKTEPAKPAADDAGVVAPTTKIPAATDAPVETKPEPVEYKPLETVQDEIREKLARDQANAKIDEWMTKLSDEMTAYNNNRMRLASEATEGSKPSIPPFDVKKIAEKIDPAISAEELILITPEEFAKHPLSASRVSLRPNTPDYSLPEVVFNERVFPTYYAYKPVAIGRRYLFWKTDHAKEEEPNLGDPKTRERAVLAWKTVEARKLAMAEAERFAKTANEAKKPLVELGNEKILPTAMNLGEFSWMTQDPQFGPQLAKVSGLDRVGDTFMSTLFGLEKDQVGTAWNEPQTIAYVVQPVKIDSLESKRAEFLQSMKTTTGRNDSLFANVSGLRKELRVFDDNLMKRYKVSLKKPFVAAQPEDE